MPNIRSVTKRIFIALTIFLVVGVYPAPVIANESSAPVTHTTSTDSQSTPATPTEQSTPPQSSQSQAPKPSTGPTQSTGADGPKYKYNEQTKLWESDKYTWDPATNQTKPKETPNYSYNSATGRWDTTEWKYNPASNTYEQNTATRSTPPTGGASTNPVSPTSNETSGTGTGADNSHLQPHVSSSGNSPALQGGSGSNSPSTISLNANGRQSYELYYNAQISNTINSSALTGDASVLQNTQGGSAMTGDALALTNLINLLQSSWAPNGQFATFIKDIEGDVVGDLHIDPGELTVVNAARTADIKVQHDVNGTINNDVNLDARSGNALVDGNTTAGDATSGNANAVANIVNMINSSIGSGQSFLGMLNIHGNFEGDVLLPPQTLQNLLADSSVPKTEVNLASISDTELTADFANNMAITNDIATNAASGSATVAGNTTAGSATTGDAATNVTVLNLTGRQVIGSNALLVFVNVLGEWVGMIVDSPNSNSAALGSGIGSNYYSGNADIDSEFNGVINNNITVNAATGNAAVTHNTRAGNATTGDATASVNLANIMNSQFNLTDWFGILFINVFGTWRGSFGIDTAFGNPIATNPQPSGSKGRSASPQEVQVFRFVPSGDSNNRTKSRKLVRIAAFDSADSTGSTASASAEQNQDEPTNKESGNTLGTITPPTGTPSDNAPQGSGSNFWIPAAGILIAAALLAAERYLSIREKRHSPTGYTGRRIPSRRKGSIDIIEPLGSR